MEAAHAFLPPPQLGVNHYMRVDASLVMRGMAEGVRAIVREVETRGTGEDRECLDYVLHRRAGSSAKTFQGGKRRDENRNGEEFSSFAALSQCRVAGLELAHVLALRLYTTVYTYLLSTSLLTTAY